MNYSKRGTPYVHLLRFVAVFPIGPCRVYNSIEQDVYDVPLVDQKGRQRRVCLTNPLVNHDKP